MPTQKLRSAHVEAEDNAGSKAARAVSRSASGDTVIAFIQRSKWQARGPGQPHCPLLRTLVISLILASLYNQMMDASAPAIT
jgi:hypothetical protein